MGALSPMHWLIIVGVLVLLFGATRLPEAARSLGRSARILKAEVRDMGDSDRPEPSVAPRSIHPAPGSAAGDPAADAATAGSAPAASVDDDPVTDSARSAAAGASGRPDS